MKDRVIALILANISVLPSSSTLGVKIGSRYMVPKRAIDSETLIELYHCILNSEISFLLKSSRMTFLPEEFEDFLGSRVYAECFIYLCSFLETSRGERIFNIFSANDLMKLERLTNEELIYSETSVGGIIKYEFSGSAIGELSVLDFNGQIEASETYKKFTIKVVRGSGLYSSGSFRVLASSPAVSDVVSSITVGGEELLSGPINYRSDAFETAKDVSDDINLSSEETGYNSSSLKDTVTIFANEIGDAPNGRVVLGLATGGLSIIGSTMANGADPSPESICNDRLEITLLTDPSTIIGMEDVSLKYDRFVERGFDSFDIHMTKPTTVFPSSYRFEFYARGCGLVKKFSVTIEIV